MDNLKFLRESRHLSQQELGLQTGISKRRISSYEKGEFEPDNATLQILSNFFDISIDKLLGNEPVFAQTTGAKLDLDMFGKRISEYRSEKNLSIKELASKAGITHSYLAAIEAGKKIPRLQVCIKILNALDASADAAFMDFLYTGYVHRARYVQAKLTHLNLENQKTALDLFESIIDTLNKKQS